MRNILVVNICQTYKTGRPVEFCARSSWELDDAKAPFIDTIVAVFDNQVRAVIKDCRLVPATPEVVGKWWDEGCSGRWYADGGTVYDETQVFTVRNECPQVYAPLASVQGIRYLTQAQFDQLPNGKVILK
ncbi:hypothetical protein [Aeromonas dhakensis]|uniref:hypothetical protein n=1 Tax=Aeromonas dhakensis TaxID=196024 RepID=UPI003B9ED964